MTVAERHRAEKWFDDNFVGNYCIICSQGTLELVDDYVCLVERMKRPGLQISLGGTEPVVVVKCTSCGHILLFDAQTIGVFDLME